MTKSIRNTRFVRTTIAITSAALLSCTAFLSGFVSADANTPITDSPLVVSELQTGGCAEEGQLSCTGTAKIATKEFIELYNQKAEILDVRGWQVQYFSNSGRPVALVNLIGVVVGHGSVLLAYDGYLTETAQATFTSNSSFGALAEGSGHVQIVDAKGQLIDRVGWGTATQPLAKAVKAPTAGRSIQRLSPSTDTMANTLNNYADFAVSDTPSPRGGGYTADPPAEEPIPEPTTTPEPSPSVVTCEGIIINEILPNPAGADGGHEFIELHNPTDEVIGLKGCSLKSGSAAYNLPESQLDPGAYRSFSDTETGITLANSAGGTVWLLSPTDELQSVNYGAALPDDVSWAFVDGNWAQTYTATSNAANVLTANEPCPANQVRNPETNRCQNMEIADEDESSSTLTPCKAGQERNPETNRCRNIATPATGLAPCKAGQSRNPETNRCVNNTSTSSAPTACKAGQERNPETNRCKAIATAAAAKACPAGQERNPDTGRCRKSTTAGGNSIAKVQDVKTPMSANPGRWLLIGAAIVIAIGYAVFEWRQEIAEKFSKLFRKQRYAVPSRA